MEAATFADEVAFFFFLAMETARWGVGTFTNGWCVSKLRRWGDYTGCSVSKLHRVAC